MNTTAFAEWVRSFPFGIEVRRLTPPEPYIAYRLRSRITVSCMAASIMLATFFSPIAHAPLAVRATVLALLVIGIGMWIFAAVRYVLAWDELQRRALAESGAATALLLMAILVLYSFGEKILLLPAIASRIWFFAGVAIWFVALPLIRKHYDA